jgi:hypothetical protein
METEYLFVWCRMLLCRKKTWQLQGMQAGLCFSNLNQYCMGRHIREVLGLDYFCFHTGVSRRGIGGSCSSAKSVRQLDPREEFDQNNIYLIKHTWLE